MHPMDATEHAEDGYPPVRKQEWELIPHQFESDPRHERCTVCALGRKRYVHHALATTGEAVRGGEAGGSEPLTGSDPLHGPSTHGRPGDPPDHHPNSSSAADTA